jgi:putative spermidine/putrescine transport system ATP-binding protein
VPNGDKPDMPPAASPPIKLVLREVSKTFGSFVGVDRCNLEIRAGEFLSILGPSGSGKTTLLRMVAGFVRPSSGTIELDGRNITMTPAYRRNLGMVFQSYTLFPHMTAAENIAFPLQMRRVGRREQEAMIAAALEQVGLGGLGGRKPKELSGGQQQRIALARALVFQPQLLLMDEPLGALDKRLREGLQQEIRRLHQSLGATVVFVTHDQSEALAMSDRIAIMNEGRIVQLGTGAELYETPSTLFAAQFMGESNLFPGRIEEHASDRLVVGEAFELRTGSNGSIDRIAPGARVVLVVRPERMRLCNSVDSAQPNTNAVRGRLISTTYLGATTRHQIAMADGRLLSIVSARNQASHIPAGDEIRVEWPVDDGVVVLDPSSPADV